MTEISIEDIKKLRQQTGAGVLDCREALILAKGDFNKALAILAEKGVEILSKKAARATGEGLIETYVHSNGKIAAMVELQCETDFVAKTPEFRNLAHELALQVVSMNPGDVDELMHQEYIRDNGRTVENLVAEVIAKTGENIKVARFIRFELGQ